ncbi:MAG: hypothetical protein H6729_12630 [Deltaproteobacteria bacterium]|nr:hypothetical protein [Deltaproteobacteria bacterium]
MNGAFCATLMLWVMSLPPDPVIDCLEQQRVWRGELSVLHSSAAQRGDIIIQDTYPAGTAYLLIHPTCRIVGLETGPLSLDRRQELLPLTIGRDRAPPSRGEARRLLDAAGIPSLDQKQPSHAGAAAMMHGATTWHRLSASTRPRVGDVTFFDGRWLAPPKQWYRGSPISQRDAWWPNHSRLDMARLADLRQPRALAEPPKNLAQSVDTLEAWIFESSSAAHASALALFDRRHDRFAFSAIARIGVEKTMRHIGGRCAFLLGPCRDGAATCLTVIDLRTGTAYAAGLATDAARHAHQIGARFENEDLVLEPSANSNARFGRRRVGLADVIHLFEAWKKETP